jgi:hypothetical protein
MMSHGNAGGRIDPSTFRRVLSGEIVETLAKVVGNSLNGKFEQLGP